MQCKTEGLPKRLERHAPACQSALHGGFSRTRQKEVSIAGEADANFQATKIADYFGPEVVPQILNRINCDIQNVEAEEVRFRTLSRTYLYIIGQRYKEALHSDQ